MLNQLTKRENELYDLLVGGKSYKDVSKRLFISVNTVKYHAKNIYEKMNVKGRIELIANELKRKK